MSYRLESAPRSPIESLRSKIGARLAIFDFAVAIFLLLCSVASAKSMALPSRAHMLTQAGGKFHGIGGREVKVIRHGPKPHSVGMLGIPRDIVHQNIA